MANIVSTTLRKLADKTGLSKFYSYNIQEYKPEYLKNHYLNSNGASDNSNILSARPAGINKIREIYRNNINARSIINTVVDNVVPGEYKFSADIPGNTPAIQALNDKLEKDWCHKFAPYIDASEQLTLTEIMETAFRRYLADGDSFSAIVKPKQVRGEYHTKIRLIDQTNVMNPSGSRNPYIQQGIERDQFLDKIRVYFTFTDDANNSVEISYPFYDDQGYVQVIQLLDATEGVGITRGAPLLFSAYNSIIELDQMKRNELRGSFFNSSLNLWWKTDKPAEQAAAFHHRKHAGGSTGTGQGKSDPIMITDPSNINFIKSEDDIKPMVTNRPNENFMAWCIDTKRDIASSLGFSYEFLWHNVTDFNSSGARFNSKTDQRRIHKYQHQLINHFLNPIKEHYVLEFFAVNNIPLPEGMTLQDICNHITFVPPKFISVDEQKDIQTSQMKIDAGLSTLEKECRDNGMDYLAVAQQRAREKELYKELGLDEPDENSNDDDDNSTPSGEVPKPPGSGPGRIAGEDSTRVA